MKTRFLVIIIILISSVSCAPMSPYEAVDSPALLQSVQNARTYNDHAALTEHFEHLAKEMRTRAEEQKKLLQHYQDKSYLYGRQAQDQQSHTWALMHRYEQAAKKSLSKAASHRQLAAELKREGYSAPGQQTADAIKPGAKNNWKN